MTQLTLESFKAQDMELFNQIDSSAYQRGIEAGMITGNTEGATAERVRIAGIESAAFTGQDDLKKQLIADGKTSAGDAAIQFNSAMKESNTAQGAKLETDAPEPVEFLENQTEEPEAKDQPKDFMVQVNAYQAENKCGKSEALKAVIKIDPDSHKAYINK